MDKHLLIACLTALVLLIVYFAAVARRSTAQCTTRVVGDAMIVVGMSGAILCMGMALVGVSLTRAANTKRYKGGDSNALIEREYLSWKATRFLMRSICRPGSSKKCRLMLEGWITRYIDPDDLGKDIGVLLGPMQNIPALKTKLRKESPALLGPVVEDINKLKSLVGKKSKDWELIGYTKEDRSITETDDALSYGEYRLNATDRIRELIAIGGAAAVLRMSLRYASILASSHHWAIPKGVFGALWELGVRNEAFASPFNSLALGKPDSSYYTMFGDVDAPFGSKGDWLKAPLDSLIESPGGWEINPPFLYQLLFDAAERATALAEAGRDVFYITRRVEGSDSPYAVLENAAKASIILYSNQHAYEVHGPTGYQLRRPSFDSHLLYAGPLSKEDAMKALLQVKAAWPRAKKPYAPKPRS